MISISVGNATADVMAKFRQDSDGLFYSERLEVEIEKKQEYLQKQSQRAKKGWENRKNESPTNATALATAMPFRNLKSENRNIDEEKEESEKEGKKILIQAKQLVSEARLESAHQDSEDEDTQPHIHLFTDEVARAFHITEQRNHTAYRSINNFLKSLDQERLEYFMNQIKYYKKLKEITGQSQCNWMTWIGTLGKPKWEEQDYETAFHLESTKRPEKAEKPLVSLNRNR